MPHRHRLLALALFSNSAAHAAPPVRITPVATPRTPARPLPMRVVGRAVAQRTPAGTDVTRQWPGTYFETRFRGRAAYFRVGSGEVILHVSNDGNEIAKLVKPAPGYYRIDGLGAGEHRVRVAIGSENQSAPTTFGGFYAAPGTTARPLQASQRQIEFIGDSHTVGYGNTSPTQSCSEATVWETTDTAQGIAPRVAAAFGADYQVNAISGRGIVRNYNGMAADTLPRAYPYALFGQKTPIRDPNWAPQVIVIALGTNDFSTALNAGEPWPTRDALHKDYAATYLRFLGQLRAAHPRAFILLWATGLADGEIEREAGAVAQRARAAGDTRVAFVPVKDLAFSACNAHPSLDDDRRIAAAIGSAIAAETGVWATPTERPR